MGVFVLVLSAICVCVSFCVRASSLFIPDCFVFREGNIYLFKLGALLGRVGVVEAHDELAVEGLLVVLVQQRCLGVTHVQVPE